MTMKTINEDIKTNQKKQRSSVYGIFIHRKSIIKGNQQIKPQANSKYHMRSHNNFKNNTTVLNKKIQTYDKKMQAHLVYIGRTNNVKIRGTQHYNMINKIQNKLTTNNQFNGANIRNEFLMFAFNIGQTQMDSVTAQIPQSIKGKSLYQQTQQWIRDQQFFKSLAFQQQFEALDDYLDNIGLPKDLRSSLQIFSQYAKTTLSTVAQQITQYNLQINPIYDNYIVLAYLQCIFGGVFKMLELQNLPAQFVSKKEFSIMQIAKTPANHIQKQFETKSECEYQESSQETSIDMNKPQLQKLLNLKIKAIIETMQQCEQTIIVGILLEGELNNLMSLNQIRQDIFRSYQQILQTFQSTDSQRLLKLYTYTENAETEAKKMGYDVCGAYFKLKHI